MLRCTQLSTLATIASGILDAPVLDKTGLTGLWNYELAFIDSNSRSSNSDPDLLPFPVALLEQLGLKLEPTRGPVDMIVIESVAPPGEN